MPVHTIRTHTEAERLPRPSQLAWKIAEVAADPVCVEPEVSEMIANRIIDNAAVAIASLNRPPLATARVQALAHPSPNGATLFGVPADQRFSAEWAAWANGTAVRELDFHDTFLTAVQKLTDLPPEALLALNPALPRGRLIENTNKGIF